MIVELVRTKKNAPTSNLPPAKTGNRKRKKREKLVNKLTVTGDLLRGSLLERIVRHTKCCPKYTRGETQRVFVLTVTYAGGRAQQFSVRRERVAEVRRSVANYQKFKQAIEEICEFNHELLRPEAHRRRAGRRHD